VHLFKGHVVEALRYEALGYDAVALRVSLYFLLELENRR